MTVPAAIRCEGIGKRFPGVVALHDVSLEVAAGSCHALCGENGAGKSTLGRILAGVTSPDAGRVYVGGRETRMRGPREALAAGVAMVHQELAACANLSVAENLCLAAMPTRRGFIDGPAMARRAESLLAETGTTLDVRRPLGALPIAERQMVQIAAALASEARIIVFDEPTSSLSQLEAERLYALIGRLTARGVACIYVSHRMPEIYRLCDMVTVLRDGALVATRRTAELGERELVQSMIGRAIAERAPTTRAVPVSEPLLVAEGLSTPGLFSAVGFSLRAGEIVGLAGLVGSGRTEIAAALFGVAPATAGRIIVRGREVQIRRPTDAIREGIGLVPEDRKQQGLVLGATSVENLSLPILGRLSRLGWVRRRRERALASRQFERLRVRASAAEVPVVELSGGTQQKVVLARWLAAGSRILLLDEPTRGVDVGAKGEIHSIISALAADGAAVLVISSELPELLGLCDRILVCRAGRLVAEVRAAEVDQEALLRLMVGLPDGTAV